MCYRLTYPHKPIARTTQDFENTVFTMKKCFFFKSFNPIIKSKGYSLQMNKKHIFVNFIDFEAHSALNPATRLLTLGDRGRVHIFVPIMVLVVVMVMVVVVSCTASLACGIQLAFGKYIPLEESRNRYFFIFRNSSFFYVFFGNVLKGSKKTVF